MSETYMQRVFILLGNIAIKVRGYRTGGIGNTMEMIETIEDN